MNTQTSKDAEKYFAYVRKSSESKERQALSIPAQIKKIGEQFPDLDIEFIQEERSAFKHENRPLFAQMLEDIEKGKRTGLIAWHPDRISRNEIDAAKITHLVRTGVIKDLKFASYNFDNSPEGIMMLQFVLSQSQYESAKKGKDVKKGMEEKAGMGWVPGPAPLGYRNADNPDASSLKEKRILIPDKDFGMYRKMFDLMLTGRYTPPKIQEIVNERWHFKTKNGKKLGRSMIYRILKSPFYYGEFEFPKGSGNWHKGKHKPMITFEEHQTILSLLGVVPETREKHRKFPYRGPIRCGECGAMVTAQRTVKRQKNGVVRFYNYYHCTGRKDENCPQKRINTRLGDIEKQVLKQIDKIEIPPEFHAWAMKWMERQNKEEAKGRGIIIDQVRREYDDVVQLLDGIIDMRARGEIKDPEVYESKEKALLEKKRVLAQELEETDKRIDKWLEVADNLFTFLENVKERLQKGDEETKTAILSALGLNFTLKDRKLRIDLLPVLLPMQTASAEVKAIHERLKPQKDVVKQEQFEDAYSKSSSLLRV